MGWAAYLQLSDPTPEVRRSWAAAKIISNDVRRNAAGLLMGAWTPCRRSGLNRSDRFAATMERALGAP